jgi:hypothetical protein
MRKHEQRIKERRNFTDWTSLEHKFPNESIGATFVEVTLVRVRSSERGKRYKTYEVDRCFLIPIILRSGHLQRHCQCR